MTKKYRGYSEKLKQWVYGELVNNHIFPHGNFGGINGVDYYAVVPESVGQFTGLSDKNDNNIFSNSIVKKGDKIAKIVFDPELGYFADGWLDEFRFNICNWEVIGNAYENPELLEN